MYNYNQYNPYAQNNYNVNNYINELQQMRERIDKQIAQQNQQQMQPNIPNTQPTNLTQNFQLAPQTNNNSELESRFAENIDEVKNTFVMKTAVFVTKDYSTMWVKDVSGNIKTYKTEEVVELDDKDIQIQELKKQIDEMKNMINEQGVKL